MTVLLTIFTGFTVFVLGQVFIRLFIEPVQELKKTIASVQFTLSKLAYIIHNPDSFTKDELKDVFKELRELSARLTTDLSLVPCYEQTGKLFFLPKINNVRQAGTNIIAVSNWLASNNTSQFAHITKNVQDAHDNLQLYYPDKERISPELLECFLTNSH
jgi:hypothetical protein